MYPDRGLGMGLEHEATVTEEFDYKDKLLRTLVDRYISEGYVNHKYNIYKGRLYAEYERYVKEHIDFVIDLEKMGYRQIEIEQAIIDRLDLREEKE